MRKEDQEKIEIFVILRWVSKFLLVILVFSLIPLFLYGNLLYSFFAFSFLWIYWGICGVKYRFIPLIPSYHNIAGKGARGFGVFLLVAGLLGLGFLTTLLIMFYQL